jgi:hypothetical protein
MPNKEEMLRHIETLSPLFLFIFSWIVMLPMGVIISGIFLGSLMTAQASEGTIFKIPLFILNIEARRNQVVAGFYAFILTFTLVIIFGGAELYIYIKERSGIDPGHFNSLCVASSVLAVIWTSIPFVFHNCFLTPKSIAPSSHAQILEDLSNR